MSAKKVEFHLVGENLPADAVAFEYQLREGLSEPYDARIAFSTKDASFSPRSILRGSLTLQVIDTDRGRTRSLTGIVDRCEFVHHDGVSLTFAVRLVPPIASLAHREDCRIYQDKSAVDVIKEIFAAAGIDKVDWQLTIDYPKREYIAQYRETELAFVHRLLEEECIFYFFKHEEGEATMILADSTTALIETLATPTVLSVAAGTEGTDPVEGLSLVSRLATSKVHLRDFDFEKPDTPPEASQDAPVPYPMPVYEYPAGFKDAEDGKRRAAARLRELRTGITEISGTTVATNLEVGRIVTVVGAAQDALNQRFVVTAHVGEGRQSQTGQGSGRADAGGGHVVTSRFAAMPEGAHFAPPRKTKKPRVHGVQTAVVTGPSMGEEEIHTEKYGRVKVRFRWDRVGQFDDKSSCWLRVLQANLGGQFIVPRVGWEVAVGFLEGDPDKPYVVGRLYNAERTPPYALPGAKTSGSIRSQSSPGGGGVNEVKFGDSGGGQGFDVTAEKDYNLTVGNDQNEKVGVDEKSITKVNGSISVGGDRSLSVGGSRELSVGSVNSANVGGNDAESVGGSAVDNAISNMVEKVTGDRSYMVGGNQTLICNTIAHSITGDLSRSVGSVMIGGSLGAASISIGGNYTENIAVAKADVCKASVGETIGGNLTQNLMACDVHVVKGSYSSASDATVTTLVGGVHYAKVDGDITVSAPMITFLGATATLKGAGSQVKLGGAPVLVKASKVKIETALLIKMGSSLKMGG